MSSRDWVYEKFFSYYGSPQFRFLPPTSFSQREFAFLLFKERAMVRHKTFPSAKVLEASIRKNIPSDVYHSCAYYENPEAEMEKKGWSGADLVFDIDADHISTSCGKLHDEWRCANPQCSIEGGFNGRGITPEACPVCGGVKFDVKTWACDQCIDTTRTETRKLLDMLMNDFGFAEKEIRTYFSGHRGYHIHVENDNIRTLDSMGRKEIVDYVSGVGLDLLNKGKYKSEKSKRKISKTTLSLSNFGWGLRLKKGMRKFIQTTKIYTLMEIGVSRKNAEVIFNNRVGIVERCIEENLWKSIKGVGPETWKRIVEHVKNQEIAQIDTVVTSDIHRLIRANGTLHGKTGLMKVEFPLKELDTFDPFVGAVAFKEGEAKVLVSAAPEFTLRGETFGPYKDKTVELPTAAAVLLVLKGRAQVVN